MSEECLELSWVIFAYSKQAKTWKSLWKLLSKDPLHLVAARLHFASLWFKQKRTIPITKPLKDRLAIDLLKIFLMPLPGHLVYVEKLDRRTLRNVKICRFGSAPEAVPHICVQVCPLPICVQQDLRFCTICEIKPTHYLQEMVDNVVKIIWSSWWKYGASKIIR